MKKEIVIIDDDDDDTGRFKVNAISKHTSTMSAKIDVPIICLDDDEDDDLKILKNHVFNDGYEAGNEKSEKTFYDDSRLENEKNLVKKRVSQQIKSETVEISRAPLMITREIIERDNRAAERRKRRIAQLEASSSVPSNLESIRRENKVQKPAVSKAETSRNVPLDKTEQNKVSHVRKRKAEELKSETLPKTVSIVSQVRKRKVEELKSETLPKAFSMVSQVRKRKSEELKSETLPKTFPLVNIGQSKASQVRKRKAEELKYETLPKTVSMVTTEQSKLSQVRKSKADELKVETLPKVVSMVKTKQNTQRDRRIAERRKRRTAENKPVNQTSRVVQVTQWNKRAFARKNNEEESVDKCYMDYLKWLVSSRKDSTTKPTVNLQKDLSDLDPQIQDILKEPTMVPEKDPFDLDPRILNTLKEPTTVPKKDHLTKVKVEVDLEHWCDDSDIVAVSDTPFFDGECTPFVSSKSMIIDLDQEGREDESSCLFRKELMDDMKRPYNETEYLNLQCEVSIQRRKTRSRELRNGRESIYETDELGQSYLQKFDDFNNVYKRVDLNDKITSLKLLRGFFFYLENVSRYGAFKPWMDHRFLQELCVLTEEALAGIRAAQASNMRCIAGPSTIRYNV